MRDTSTVDISNDDLMRQEIEKKSLRGALIEKGSLASIERNKFRKINNDNAGDDDETNCENLQPLELINLDELAWHDRADDCWIAIYDYVYDCTEFVNSHPGGRDVILEYAGRDATIAFIGSGHSNNARKILEKYLIGELPENERIFRKIGGLKIVDA